MNPNGNTKFLDEVLFDYVAEYKVNSTADARALVDDLYRFCDLRWKPKVKPETSMAEIKVLLDRTFNSWDLFVKRLLLSGVKNLARIMEIYSYRNAFMANDKLKNLYGKMK